MRIYLLKKHTYDMCNKRFYDDIEVYDSYESALKREEELFILQREEALHSSNYWGYNDDIEIEEMELEESLNLLFYKGFYTAIRYDSETKTLYGKIENLFDLIEFKSDTCKGIEEEFHKAVDKYLEFKE